MACVAHNSERRLIKTCYHKCKEEKMKTVTDQELRSAVWRVRSRGVVVWHTVLWC